MIEAISLLTERLLKAEAKAERQKKSLEAALEEVQKLRTTIEVLEGLADESAKGSGREISSRQDRLLAILPDSEFEGTPPIELFDVYRGNYQDFDNLEAFRTALWRLKDDEYRYKGGTWTVKAEAGRYWREEVTPEAEISSHRWDLDSDDVPF